MAIDAQCGREKGMVDQGHPVGRRQNGTNYYVTRMNPLAATRGGGRGGFRAPPSAIGDGIVPSPVLRWRSPRPLSGQSATPR